MARARLIAITLAGVAALAAGLWIGQGLSGSQEPPPQVQGFVMSERPPVVPFTLTDQDGEPFGPERWRGHWSLLYFGYTYCPDVCPTALTELAQLQKALRARNAEGDLHYWMVSVDPQRDSPQRLKTYVHFFSPSFEGATGSEAELKKLMHQFGVVAMRAPGGGEDSYTIDHSSTFTLIDPEGRLIAIFTPPHDPETMLPQLLAVQAYYQRIR